MLPHFWEGLAPAENLFVFQADSVLCTRSEYSLNHFLGYDWMGPVPPSEEDNHFTVDGSFSLRRRSAILQIANAHAHEYDGTAEVSNLCLKQGKDSADHIT